jgi:hypothetical protein
MKFDIKRTYPFIFSTIAYIFFGIFVITHNVHNSNVPIWIYLPTAFVFFIMAFTNMSRGVFQDYITEYPQTNIIFVVVLIGYGIMYGIYLFTFNIDNITKIMSVLLKKISLNEFKKLCLN